MEDFNFDNLANQSKIIDEVLVHIARKLQDPVNFGSGKKSLIRLAEMDREVMTYKAVMDSMIKSLQHKIDTIKSSNAFGEEFLINHKRELERLHEIGRESGFTMPNDYNAVSINNISPIRPPSERNFDETPLSSLRRNPSHFF